MTYQLELAGKTGGEIFAQIDSLIPLSGEGSPVGVRAASDVGILYTDTLNGAWYRSTAGDGTVLGTSWDLIIFSIEAATTTQAGVVELATPEEVAAGTDNTKAITPFSLGTGLATQAALQTEINTRTSADNSINAALDVVETAISEATSSATASKIMKRDGAGRVQIVAGSASSDAVTKGQMDAADGALQGQIDTNTTDLTNATDAATANRLVRRSADGKGSFVAGTASDHAIVKSQLDTVQSALEASIARLMGGAAVSQLTLSNALNGTATPTSAWHTLETHASYSAAQNLTNLLLTNSIKMVIVQPVNAAHVITLKHGDSGDGGLVHRDSSDIIFTSTHQAVWYVLIGTKYYEMARFGFVATGGAARSNKSTNFNVSTGEQIYVCSAALTATLPSMAGSANSRITMVLTGRFNVTLGRNSAQINGVAEDMVVRGPCSVVIVEDGTSWWTVGAAR